MSHSSVPRTTSNQHQLLNDGAARLKLFTGEAGAQRRDCERALLELWRLHGFQVPTILEDVPDTESGVPCLKLTHIPGVSLQAYLRSSAASDEKRSVLTGVFRENRRRHDTAIAQRNPLLFHSDLNTGNIIIQDGRVFYIDLEQACTTDELTDAAAMEIAKICRWIVRDLGIASMDEVLGIVLKAYAGQEFLLERLVARACDRRLQRYHRFRDWMRKRKDAHEVTKYDIADGLARLLAVDKRNGG